MLAETGGKLVCWTWDDEPLEVEPLASLIPTPTAENMGRLDGVGDTVDHTHENDTPQLSEWTLGQLAKFGEYLGTSMSLDILQREWGGSLYHGHA